MLDDAANITEAEIKADITEALQSSAMLATLSTGHWSPKRVDRKLRKDVAAAHTGADAAFSVTKKLLAGADRSFEDVISIQNNLRHAYYNMTAPFTAASGPRQSGPRLISSARWAKLVQITGEAKRAMRDALDQALDSYEDAKAVAKRNLGSAYDPTDYPEKDELRSRFFIDIDFAPVPSGAMFAGIGDSAVASLSEHIAKRNRKKLESVQADVRERAVDAVRRVLERLTALDNTLDDPSVRTAALHATVFSDAEAALDLISDFHAVLPDPLVKREIDVARDTLKKFVAAGPDALKTHKAVRTEIIDDARETMNVFVDDDFEAL